jgi:predicted ArsR family transcriptional regulator
MTKAIPSPIGGVADDLAAVLALRELVELREDAAVEKALREGWTWSQVAEALGVTRQAVHKRHLRRVAAAGISLRRRNE